MLYSSAAAYRAELTSTTSREVPGRWAGRTAASATSIPINRSMRGTSRVTGEHTSEGNNDQLPTSKQHKCLLARRAGTEQPQRQLRETLASFASGNEHAKTASLSVKTESIPKTICVKLRPVMSLFGAAVEFVIIQSSTLHCPWLAAPAQVAVV